MKEKWNYILYLIWFSYLILSAVLMFGHGFLLSRKTLSDVTDCVPLHEFDCDGHKKTNSSMKDSCTDDEKIKRVLSVPGGPMACVPSSNRVVFMLVDALRYDFTEYDTGLEKPLPYQNRLPVMKNTLDKWPERSRLFRCMADPPTTTLQRVKALVTGSLPTFIDVSSNFAATELQEDNVIDQVVKGGGSAVLLGDDTWSRLIPGKWLRSHALYSFHTWDLDTVDKEVDSKIYDELLKDDWNILVAHYLGIDHAGHRYGPNHPEMTRKLNETNSRLEKIIDMLPSDVTLYVVGDHGMTETGDHGGESKAERMAALFAYRKDGFGDMNDMTTGMEVQQTDLAPTMSAALGRPPPAPCLGTILFSVLPRTSLLHTLLHISNNLKQITNYLVRYGEESQQVPLDRLAQLINATREQINKASTVQTDEELRNYIADVRVTMDNVKNVFREVWVEFDSLSMLRALLLMLLAIFFNWLITEGIPSDRLPAIFASSFVPTGVGACAAVAALCGAAQRSGVAGGGALHGALLGTGLASGAVLCALVLMHWDGVAARWHAARPRTHERFARAALVASAAALASNSYVIEEGASLAFLAVSALALMAWSAGSLKAVAYWAAFGATLALSRNYRACREEQGACWAGGAAPARAGRGALVAALGAAALLAGVARRAGGRPGAAVGGAALLAAAHWAAGWGALGSAPRSRLLARLAWAVLGLVLAALGVRRGFAGPAHAVLVGTLAVAVANALVLGAALAPAALLALLAGSFALNVVASLKGDGAAKSSVWSRCSSSVACVWTLAAWCAWHGSGHAATLAHVRWGAAFHAGDPHALPHGRLIIAALVALEQFGMPFMFGVSVPLLAVWQSNGLGPRSQLAAVFTISLKFALCYAIRVFACAISATIHCRHLMIWGVFTPKLLFECGACAAALLGTLLGATIFTWHLPTQQRSS